MEKLEVDDDTYEAVIKALVDTDPETLVNVFSRVLRDRTDTEYIVTGTPDEHSSVETAQLTVPGVVGTVSGVRNPDRLFTIAIRGNEKAGQHEVFATLEPRPTGPWDDEPTDHLVEARVSRIPDCDFCKRRGDEVPATHDGKTKTGFWANMCDQDFAKHGIGLGLGRGQRLIKSD